MKICFLCNNLNTLSFENYFKHLEKLTGVQVNMMEWCFDFKIYLGSLIPKRWLIPKDSPFFNEPINFSFFPYYENTSISPSTTKKKKLFDIIFSGKYYISNKYFLHNYLRNDIEKYLDRV